ncbi:carboxypeptidase-like regulatory domain-containing protein [Larkinella soli]|uniref:carboxypeptidase-like regulatory domain-containing protein n=1 Tax=Larkinella soli TaxID=1770527 RepID=UPI0013E2BE5A|nr:carboxypeptidase-like regulatory domain-containing protein [Larkinella soli]
MLAQKIITGVIISEADHRPVPYALITETRHRFGTYADAEGRFSAHIPSEADTLLIACIGYQTRLIPVADLTGATVWQLRPNPTQLPEVLVRGTKPKLFTTGAIRKRSPIVWGNCSGRNIEFALHLRNPDHLRGYLHQVRYLVARGGVPTAPFRVRVYACTEGAPGEDLLPESVVTAARRGNSWCEIDLSRYGIRFPEEGLFVAMEWLPTHEARYRFSLSAGPSGPLRVVRECFGQYLAFSRDLRPASYWERINGGIWRRHTPFSRTGQGEHPVIQARIAVTE